MIEAKEEILNEIMCLRDEKRAEASQRFFKTEKGGYGEGDKFLGITVPISHQIASKYYKITALQTVLELVKNEYHEIRLIALDMLLKKYQKSKDDVEKLLYVNEFMKNLEYVNNWDLVDMMAPRLSGDYIANIEKNGQIRTQILSMATSKVLWERRIAIMSTFAYIRNKEFQYSLDLAKILINDSHDLMHKAVGWMLREVGNRDEKVLCDFLDENIKQMPRTMVRYAIEKLEESKRKYYLNLK